MKLNNIVIYKTLLVIFFLAFLGYLLNLPIDYSKSRETKVFRRLLTSNDNTAATFLPYEIITKGTLYFSPDTIDAMRQAQTWDSTVYSVMRSGNRYFSSYPILSGIMALPIFLLPVLLNLIKNVKDPNSFLKILALGRISASFFTAISVVFFYLILREVNKLKNIKIKNFELYVYMIFYAFGTNLYSIASRSLWQHTSSLLFISILIYMMLKSLGNEKWVKWMGFFAALLYIARPLNIVFVVTLSLYVLLKYRKQFIYYILFALPFCFLLLAYNTYAFGSPFTTEYVVKGNTQFSTPLLKGVVGNLFSPTRSFLFITPILVAAYYGMYVFFIKKRKDGVDKIMVLLSITYIIIFLLYSKWWCWDGADRFGYGFFTEWLPITALLTYLVLVPKKDSLKIILMVLIVYSLYTQFNAVWFRKSRCNVGTNDWTFECIKPAFFQKQEY